MEEVRSLLQEIKPEIDFTNAGDFIEEGLLDSFDIVMLVASLDATYNISINGRDIIPEHFATVESIWNLVEKYRS